MVPKDDWFTRICVFDLQVHIIVRIIVHIYDISFSDSAYLVV